MGEAQITIMWSIHARQFGNISRANLEVSYTNPDSLVLSFHSNDKLLLLYPAKSIL